MAKELIIILGNQLVPNHPALRAHPDAEILMIEADDLCRKYKYHKHKLMLVLASMRKYRDELKRDVTYVEHKAKSTFKAVLKQHIIDSGTTHLIWMHASDRGPNRLLASLAKQHDIKTTVYPNKQFITSTADFGGWLDSQTAKTPLMETFYRWQRKRLDLLMDGIKPEGASWNFDHENRDSLPKSHTAFPALPSVRSSKHVIDVAKLVDEQFADHPGDVADFWLPTSRSEALQWLKVFVDERLKDFGRFEDAMRSGQPFLYHSIISPLLNLGLLTPEECVETAIEAYEKGEAPLNSVEGFVRQIIGWREFMYGLYWWKQNDFDKNFFDYKKKLEDWWYTESFRDQDLPEPLLDVLDRAHTYGYNHHIERLMVLGNWFLISGYQPRSVYDWFMSMYVDAYEWVMIPNVLGMSQYADGGMLATKPYVSGSNYLQKMGRWWESDVKARESLYTEKYWQFVYDNRGKFSGNHRMSLIVKQAQKKFE